MTGESLPPAAQIADAPWWRSAVIYQIWPQSFADADGDGTGDLPGITARLGYLAGLGVGAIWLSSFYRSPRADAGYNVADYRQIDPAFGTLEDLDDLLTGARRLGLRVMIDLVPNHTSDQHTWFRQALASQPGSAERARYLFLDGKGDDGSVIPNNWISDFGGPAWTRLTNADGTTDQWYLHSFAPQQPDLNWQNPEVREEFSSILRFWLDRGVDGFRVDVAHGLVKEEGLPDWDGVSGVPDSLRGTDVAHGVFKNFGQMWDQDGVHEIYRNWRKVLDSYPGDRAMVAEAWVPDHDRLARYIRSDEFHHAFNFDFLATYWNAESLRDVITRSLRAAAAVGAPATWVLSNHDVVRHASRLGLPSPGGSPPGISAADPQPDEDLGLRRARAATMLILALPGSAYLWQGEELGLPEHTTLDNTLRQDPIFFRTNGAEAGRDGCRIPLPWQSATPAFGFSETGRTWLPQPPSYRQYTADVQLRDPSSTLQMYRAALGLRRQRQLGLGSLTWLDLGQDVVAFVNSYITVVVNLGSSTLTLPGGQVLMASLPGAVTGSRLAPDTAVWLAS